jgi:8-oxo-dGTP diphosphatase
LRTEHVRKLIPVSPAGIAILILAHGRLTPQIRGESLGQRQRARLVLVGPDMAVAPALVVMAAVPRHRYLIVSVIPCVGAIIKDDQGRLLLIKRGHEPGAGLWSLPGGRIEPGETDAEALVREMREETGLEVEAGDLIGAVQRPGLGGTVIDIKDYAATVIGGTLTPGDDAADARWVNAWELESMAITEGLVEALTSWGVLPETMPRPAE